MDTTQTTKIDITLPHGPVTTLRTLLDAGATGYLTTDHAQSSHGLPVVVTDDGQVLGVAEVVEIRASTYVETDDEAGRDIHRELTDADRSMLEAARRAGYVVR